MSKPKVSRREFLRYTTLASAAAAITACAPAATATLAPTAVPATKAPEPTKAPAATTAPAATSAPAATTAPVATTAPTKAPTAVPTADPNAAVAKALPRKETLYFNGQQWDPVKGWNPYSSNNNNAMAIAQQDNARVLVFETPYLYNMIDGKQYPLLADGPWAWDAKMTVITFKLKKAAKWNDGTPVTADDVAYTWASNIKYETTVAAGYKDFIDTITAVDPQTVSVKAKLDASGKAANPLRVFAYLSTNYVIQKAWTQKLEARVANDATKFKADPAEDAVSSGPYKKFFTDQIESCAHP